MTRAQLTPVMILAHLPFADISGIETNFQNVGLQTGWTVQQFLAQCFAVTILFIVMYKFAWKKVLVILEERRQTSSNRWPTRTRSRRNLQTPRQPA